MSDLSVGELPTTGAGRSGPVGWLTGRPTFPGVRPIAMRIPVIQLDAEIERRPVIDGIMSDPTGPYVVAWYGATSKLGTGGNVVIAGHVDYAGVGPAVFARIADLTTGDLVEMTGENLRLYQFEVAWSKLFDSEKAPVTDLTGATDIESVTMITCGGSFDSSAGRYTHRLVVRAERLI